MSSNRLSSIDALRGLAIALVVAVHIPHDVPPDANPIKFLACYVASHGGMGVSLFILISGFCIHFPTALQTKNSPDFRPDWRSFWRRRLVRLYIPYLLAMVGSGIILHTALPAQAYPRNDLLPDLILHGLLLHNLTDQFAFGMGNGALWTLGMEAQLYALYPLVLIAMRIFGATKAVAAISSLSIIWILAYPRLGNPSIFHINLGSYFFWPFAWWHFWVLGVLASEAYISRTFSIIRLQTLVVSSVLVFLTSIAFSDETVFILRNQSTFPSLKIVSDFPSTLRSLLVTTASAVGIFGIVTSLIMIEARIGKLPGIAWLSRLGQISYSVYLTHPPTLRLLKTYAPVSLGADDFFLRYAVYSSVVILVAVVFYRFVEQPCITWSQKLLTRRKCN